MLDKGNRAEPYGELAEECRRLATSTPSSQIKNRYLLMAQDYMWLADIKEQAHAHRTPGTVEENGAWAASMTGRFPGPWRIVEIPHGFAVDDATGQQLAVFYGLAAPNTARQTDFLTIDEARQMAVDFAKPAETARADFGSKPDCHLPGRRQTRQARNKSLGARSSGNLAFTPRRPVASTRGLAFG